MKTTRILLAFAAALSLGLAVFANVRANHNVVTPTQSTSNATDELATEPSGADNAAASVKIAWDGVDCLTGAVTGVNVAWDGVDCLTGHAPEAVTT